jgi:uncharacterized protein YodC (DUF2158 family)
MNKGDFVGGMLVQQTSGGPVMTLGGSEDNWICRWVDGAKAMTAHFKPEDLQPASDIARSP